MHIDKTLSKQGILYLQNQLPKIEEELPALLKLPKDSCSLDGSNLVFKDKCLISGGVFQAIEEERIPKIPEEKVTSLLGAVINLADRVKQVVSSTNVLPVTAGISLYCFLKNPLPEGSNSFIQLLKFVGVAGGAAYALSQAQETLFESTFQIPTALARLGTVAVGTALIPLFKKIYSENISASERLLWTGVAAGLLAGTTGSFMS